MQTLFEILLLTSNSGKISKGEKHLRGNLSCYISGKEGRRKLKFGDVSPQICQLFLRENKAKKSAKKFPMQAANCVCNRPNT